MGLTRDYYFENPDILASLHAQWSRDMVNGTLRKSPIESKVFDRLLFDKTYLLLAMSISGARYHRVAT